MHAVSVDQRGDGAAVNDIEAPSLQRKLLIDKIVDW
jgi:hypothetical protein